MTDSIVEHQTTEKYGTQEKFARCSTKANFFKSTLEPANRKNESESIYLITISSQNDNERLEQQSCGSLSYVPDEFFNDLTSQSQLLSIAYVPKEKKEEDKSKNLNEKLC